MLEDIRTCDDCRKIAGVTPFVYGAPTSRILVVSKVPLKRAFKNNEGSAWAENPFARHTRKTPARLREWLGLDAAEADREIFWIQRANCVVDGGQGYAYSHCSCKYIPRAIRAICPQVIVTAGRKAAEWFLQFRKLEDVVGKSFTVEQDGQEYRCVPFPHPSGANANWISKNEKRLERAQKIVREILAE